jgi:hypothetical protein
MKKNFGESVSRTISDQYLIPSAVAEVDFMASIIGNSPDGVLVDGEPLKIRASDSINEFVREEFTPGYLETSSIAGKDAFITDGHFDELMNQVILIPDTKFEQLGDLVGPRSDDTSDKDLSKEWVSGNIFEFHFKSEQVGKERTEQV